MGKTESVVVVGAGAMGTALASHLAQRHPDVALLATDRDGHIVQAWRQKAPHPTLQVPFHELPCYPRSRWPEVLPGAELVFVAVSSAGLARVLADLAPLAAPDVWVLATKGWEPGTLRTPSEVATTMLGADSVVALTGPGLAAEIVTGAPTALLCAGTDRESRHLTARALSNPTTLVFTTSDIPGAETAAAFKNVVAVAVGLGGGLAERLSYSALTHGFGNARAAMFARGMLDMHTLVEARGGRTATVMGLAGAGDLYLTCQRGRNGRFGQLLGAGTTVEAAVRSIGSTVEGVANTAAALELAERSGVELVSARIVGAALQRAATKELTVEWLRDTFLTTLATAGPLPVEPA
jgi:glycerol-3-phosphate dehydrogenase (NAD(P)+)